MALLSKMILLLECIFRGQTFESSKKSLPIYAGILTIIIYVNIF